MNWIDFNILCVGQLHSAIYENEIYNMFDVNIDSVGMTWIVDNKNNVIWHNGSTTNFNSYIGFNRENKIGVVVLSNISSQKDINMTLIGNKIMHELLY